MEGIKNHLNKCMYKSEKQPKWLQDYLSQKQQEFEAEEMANELLDDKERDMLVQERNEPLAVRLLRQRTENKENEDDQSAMQHNNLLGRLMGNRLSNEPMENQEKPQARRNTRSMKSNQAASAAAPQGSLYEEMRQMQGAFDSDEYKDFDDPPPNSNVEMVIEDADSEMRAELLLQ